MMIPGKERNRLYAHLERLLETGIDLDKALELMLRHERGGRRRAIEALLKAVRTGEELSAASAGLPRLHLRLFSLGQKTGQLGRLLGQLRQWDEQGTMLRRRLLGPIGYPVVLLLMVLLVRPLSELIRGGTEAYVSAVFGPLALVVLVPAGLILVGWLVPGVKERMLNWVPWVSRARRYLDSSVYLYSVGLCQEVGLTLSDSLELAGENAPNERLRHHSEEFREAALQDKFDVDGFADAKLFGTFGRDLLLTASLGGSLGTACLETSGILREDANGLLLSLIRLLGLVLYLVAALTVALTVISFFEQMYTGMEL